MGGASSPRCTAVEHWARQAAGPTPIMLIQHAGPLLLRRPNESPTGHGSGPCIEVGSVLPRWFTGLR